MIGSLFETIIVFAIFFTIKQMSGLLDKTLTCYAGSILGPHLLLKPYYCYYYNKHL